MIAPNYGRQALLVYDNPEEFQAMVRAVREEQDMAITSAFHRDGYFWLVFGEDTGWTRPATTTTWDPTKGPTGDDGPDGSYITSLIKVGDMWQAYSYRGTGITGQRVAALESWPELEEYISSEWDQDRVITDMVNQDDRYYVVTSSGLDCGQSWHLDPGYPEAILGRAAAEGRHISEVMRVEDQYLWIASSYTDYGFVFPEIDPSVDLLEIFMEKMKYWEGFNGYHVALVREVLGKICLVLAK